MLGDYGNFQTNASISYLNFDRMEAYIQNQREKFTGLIILGDVLYAKSFFFPTLHEQSMVMRLLTDRPTISSLPVYHIRGNHDFEYDYEIYQGLGNLHSNWLPRPKYYFEVFNLNDGSGKQVLVLFIDTTVIRCGFSKTGHMFNCTD